MITDMTQPFDKKIFFSLLAIAILGFGNAASLAWLSPIAAIIGFALPLLILRTSGFIAGWTVVSFAILCQSSWLLSHPYGYIVVIWILLSILLALPYAVIGRVLIRYPHPSFWAAVGFAACFTLLEWGYTLLPCGYSFQSAATMLSWSVLPLQLASIFGALGLGFCVFLTNILAYFYLITKNSRFALLAIYSAVFPYLMGGLLYLHRVDQQQAFNLTTLPKKIAYCHMEEPPDVQCSHMSPYALHRQEWLKIFPLLSTLSPGEVDFVVLPEGAVPFAADSPLFTSSGPSLSSLDITLSESKRLHAPILIGLEGRELSKHGEILSHNSCFFVSDTSIDRYDKQLLIPLGEYIPFSALKSCLSAYGIHDSFAHGVGPKVFEHHGYRITPLICYEETFSRYAISASNLHPNILVTMSSDCWYPTVRYHHFELARLRALELGIPMVRSSNQGISGAVDALGNIVSLRGNSNDQNCCVTVLLSRYTVPSFYASVGSLPFLIALCIGAFVVVITVYRKGTLSP